MLKTFDASVPLAEQIIRSGTRRKHGRKHEKRIGPGRVQPKGVNAVNAKRMARFISDVRAYWSGKRDEFPRKP